MNPDAGKNGWSLEVVRGRDAGRRYALAAGEQVLGNGLGGRPGIDLADQEGDSPRRMAARQASVESAAGRLTLKDLDSPGGTFVNRKRVLPGQALPLGDGDVIQLGAVQLRVTAAGGGPKVAASAPSAPAAPPPPARPAPSAFVFTLNDGPTCRSWDDFLTVSAQRWAALREELTSGRLSAFLASIGRKGLTPTTVGTPDERLDDWLGKLPTIKPAHPEIDVHPTTLAIKVAAGGGTTRRALQVTNVGYRLLRATARVEPPGTAWLRLPPEFDGRPFLTVEATDIPVEVSPPERLASALSAAVVFEGNGGTRRVPVTLGLADRRDAIPAAVATAPRSDWDLSGLVARQPIKVRLLAWPLAALAARALILAGNLWIASPEGTESPGLQGPAVLFGLLGAGLGATLAGRRGSASDVPTGGFAGAAVGIFLAALLVATCRAIEPPGGVILALGTWAVAGATVAGLSSWAFPAVSKPEAMP